MHYTFVEGVNKENIMALHEETEDFSVSDFNYDGDRMNAEETKKKKKIKKLIEERLERKRLKDEFKDDFDELSGEFDWDELDK